MSSLPTIATAGGSVDHVDRRAGTLRAEEARGRKAEAADPGTALKTMVASGVHTSFSPQSLRALEDSALVIAGDVKELVTDVGQLGVSIIDTAAGSIDALGESAAGLVSSGAENLVKGIDAVRSGVSEVADAVGDTVTEAASRAGEAVESAVGYAALAALAGGALIDVLA